MIITNEYIIAELDTLVRNERLLEKLLERASRSPSDPREVAYLWNLATECRDHARILARHRREIASEANDIPYPRWPRGQGPQPDEAMELARDLALEIAGQYRSSETLADDPYLRKFLTILADEHYQRALELKGIANGAGIFEEFEEEEESIVD